MCRGHLRRGLSVLGPGRRCVVRTDGPGARFARPSQRAHPAVCGIGSPLDQVLVGEDAHQRADGVRASGEAIGHGPDASAGMVRDIVKYLGLCLWQSRVGTRRIHVFTQRSTQFERRSDE